jgi:hypothetical protein
MMSLRKFEEKQICGGCKETGEAREAIDKTTTKL